MPVTSLQPHQVAEHLAVGTSTLRRWSKLYGEFLSAGSSVIDEEGRQLRRTYSAVDVVTLERIKAYTDAGLTHAAVLAELRKTSPQLAGEGEETTALVELTGTPVRFDERGIRLAAEAAATKVLAGLEADRRVLIDEVRQLIGERERQLVAELTTVTAERDQLRIEAAARAKRWWRR